MGPWEEAAQTAKDEEEEERRTSVQITNVYSSVAPSQTNIRVAVLRNIMLRNWRICKVPIWNTRALGTLQPLAVPFSQSSLGTGIIANLCRYPCKRISSLVPFGRSSLCVAQLALHAALALASVRSKFISDP